MEKTGNSIDEGMKSYYNIGTISYFWRCEMKREQIAAEAKRLNQLYAEIDQAYHEAARRLGLSDSVLAILYAVCDLGEPCDLREVIRLAGSSKQTINSALRKLEQEGILHLEKDGGRKKKVCLTEQGRCLIKEAILPLIELENEIYEGWTKQERELYLRLTQEYLESFREKTKTLERRKG